MRISRRAPTETTSEAPLSLGRISFEALGSTCELLAVGVAGERLEEAADWVRRMHARLTRFEPASELSHFNASAGPWREVSEELEALLREALRAYDVSGGLVHAGVLPAMLAIGYTRDLAAGPTVLTAPAPIRLRPLPETLEVRDGRARLAPGAAVDLGGIAKGWLADRLATSLGENVLANLGGDLYARGRGPDGEGWPIGFGDRTVLLADAGVATSGTQARRWGEGLHHLIDPRTGLPAASDLRRVSVIAPTAADAEILAKTALLLGAALAAGYLSGKASGWWLG